MCLCNWTTCTLFDSNIWIFASECVEWWWWDRAKQCAYIFASSAISIWFFHIAHCNERRERYWEITISQENEKRKKNKYLCNGRKKYISTYEIGSCVRQWNGKMANTLADKRWPAASRLVCKDIPWTDDTLKNNNFIIYNTVLILWPRSGDSKRNKNTQIITSRYIRTWNS